MEKKPLIYISRVFNKTHLKFFVLLNFSQFLVGWFWLNRENWAVWLASRRGCIWNGILLKMNDSAGPSGGRRAERRLVASRLPAFTFASIAKKSEPPWKRFDRRNLGVLSCALWIVWPVSQLADRDRRLRRRFANEPLFKIGPGNVRRRGDEADK